MNDETNSVISTLIEALEWYIENDDVYEGDTPLPNHGGLTWNEMNSYWLEGKQRAIAAIARARSIQADPV